MVPHQRETPAGELDPNLVGPARIKANGHQAGLLSGQPGKFQLGLPDPGPLPPDDEHFVFTAVLEQQVLPDLLLRGRTVDLGQVLFYKGPCLNLPGKHGGSLGCAGVDHDSADIFVQPMDRVKFPAQLGFQCLRHADLGIQPHGLDADAQRLVLI